MQVTEQEVQEGSILDTYGKIEELQALGKKMNKEQKAEYKRLIDKYNEIVGFKAMKP